VKQNISETLAANVQMVKLKFKDLISEKIKLPPRGGSMRKK
jgi:hypothetical protein